MGFCIGTTAKIKEVVSVFENYTVCKLAIIKKNKETQKTDLVFSGFVRFLGQAHKNKPRLDQTIKILNCDVTNCYVQNGQTKYNKYPVYILYDYTVEESYGLERKEFVAPIDASFLDMNSDELPF